MLSIWLCRNSWVFMSNFECGRKNRQMQMKNGNEWSVAGGLLGKIKCCIKFYKRILWRPCGKILLKIFFWGYDVFFGFFHFFNLKLTYLVGKRVSRGYWGTNVSLLENFLKFATPLTGGRVMKTVENLTGMLCSISCSYSCSLVTWNEANPSINGCQITNIGQCSSLHGFLSATASLTRLFMKGRLGQYA